ncbi:MULTISPECIES: hypothetical protein [Leuconostoc]|uniref:hypothetical protein n=1 Tax=Leuconostoc TaxID=1243 RepID=UPI000B9D5D3A|nr:MULTISPECIES: hypothetical protein [Leuconostoc]MCT4377393.1 hypothetical protein [Leuconostoc suionicum]QXC53657.1 hypothetical protein EZV74_02420 [Leuconostoc mesenteroides]BAX73353.1 hypothetical protein LEMES_01910 [Leuconostoc mesenteroides]
MIVKIIKSISNFFDNWLAAILFIIGIALIDIGAFYFNVIIGFTVSGLLFVAMAIILNMERRE